MMGFATTDSGRKGFASKGGGPQGMGVTTGMLEESLKTRCFGQDGFRNDGFRNDGFRQEGFRSKGGGPQGLGVTTGMLEELEVKK